MKRKILTILLIAVLGISACGVTTSCTTMRGHWGVEGEYNPDDGYYYGHKPPKHKKHKHKKHKKHHHYHDDD